MRKLFFMCLCLFSLSCVFAETLTITNGFKLSSGETRSIPLHGMYMVKKLKFRRMGIPRGQSMLLVVTLTTLSRLVK